MVGWIDLGFGEQDGELVFHGQPTLMVQDATGRSFPATECPAELLPNFDTCFDLAVSAIEEEIRKYDEILDKLHTFLDKLEGVRGL